jgi:hypothetical protein
MIDYKLSLENIRNILLINSKIYCKNRHFYVTLPSKNINFVFTIFYNENLLKEKSNIYHLAFSPIFNSIISYNYFTTNKIYPPVFFITNNYLLAILLYKFEQIEKNKVLIKGHLELNIFNKIARRNLQYSFSKSIELIEHYFRYFILNKEVVISLNKNLYNRQLVDIEKIDSITVVKKFYINNILYYYKDLLLNKRKDISILMESKKDKEIYKKVYYPRINFLIGINFNNIDTSLFTKRLKIYTTIENNIDPFSF